jgi:hypothetical protein
VIIEDVFNKQWKAALIFGRQLTMDKAKHPAGIMAPSHKGQSQSQSTPVQRCTPSSEARLMGIFNLVTRLTGDLLKGYRKVAYRFHRHCLMATFDDKAIPAIVVLFRHGWIFTNSSDTPRNSSDM